MLGELFYWLFNMSVAATVCGIPVLLLRAVKKIPRRIFVWLWWIPFCRMVLPVGLSSEYGLMALLAKITTKTVTFYESGRIPAFTMMNYVMGADRYFPLAYKTQRLEALFQGAAVIWLTVGLAGILLTAGAYFSGLREQKNARYWKENLYFSPTVKTPGVYGILKPKILIPTAMEGQEMTYVLMHERTHIRRKDNLIRLLALLTGILHWFNPFGWLFLKLLFTDLEQACDEAVLTQCTGEQRKEYARALLSAAERTRWLASSFGGGRLRPRIENILSYRRLSAGSAVAFGTLILAIACFLLTNA